MNEVIETYIFKAYVAVLALSYAPGVSAVMTKFDDLVDREAASSIYSEIKFKITETDVVEILNKYKCSYTYYGEAAYDAQSVLFEGWIESIKLLRSGGDG
jgi:hypothetical protein